jgi:hypothetical protein
MTGGSISAFDAAAEAAADEAAGSGVVEEEQPASTVIPSRAIEPAAMMLELRRMGNSLWSRTTDSPV